jgi:C4-dicarboxylate-specific signal transduction histidine kinase
MLLDKPGTSADELGSILDDIISADCRAGEVIHRLRMLLKKGDIRYEAVSINDLIDSTLRLLHSEFIGRRVTVRLRLAPDVTLIRGDTIQLQQVLLNLILNAIDAMEELSPSSRIITIATASKANEDVEIEIEDMGTGLPPGGKSEAFKPFFTTKKRGLGLGLSICDSIIRSHGGSLSLENNTDKGATARFWLPAHRMDEVGA